MTDVIDNKQLREHFPALIEAALVVGSVQIRNRATLAGNLCNASPAADTAPPLLAYGAIVNLVSDRGSRQLPLDDFFTGPGRTVLAPGEIVESIDLPLPIEPTGSAFGRLTRRHGVDLAIVSVCCVAARIGRGSICVRRSRPAAVRHHDPAGRSSRRHDERRQPDLGSTGERRLSPGDASDHRAPYVERCAEAAAGEPRAARGVGAPASERPERGGGPRD